MNNFKKIEINEFTKINTNQWKQKYLSIVKWAKENPKERSCLLKVNDYKYPEE